MLSIGLIKNNTSNPVFPRLTSFTKSEYIVQVNEWEFASMESEKVDRDAEKYLHM